MHRLSPYRTINPRVRSSSKPMRKANLRKVRGWISLALLLSFVCVPSMVVAQKAPSGEAQSRTAGETLQEEDAEFEETFGEDFGTEFDFEDEFGAESEEEVFDPLHGYNRFMTDVNDTIYEWVLIPTAKGYRWAVPETPRVAIGNFFDNLAFPIRFVNNLLQLKFKNAGEELLRFGVNTTIGILGFADPAKNWMGLEAHPEDFGQTLGFYGVGGGFPIVLPILGPSNLRDTIGLVPDNYLDPINQLESREAVWGVQIFKAVNAFSLRVDEYESLRRDSLDLYPFLRDIYEQNRQRQIKE